LPFFKSKVERLTGNSLYPDVEDGCLYGAAMMDGDDGQAEEFGHKRE
jgi:hypothetical protein